MPTVAEMMARQRLGTAQQQRNSVVNMMQRQAENGALQASLTMGQAAIDVSSPDTLASMQRLAESMRVPVAAIMEAPEQARSQDIFNRTREFLAKRPQLTQFFEDPVNAGLTYDDLGAIQDLSNLLEVARRSELKSGITDFSLDFLTETLAQSGLLTVFGTQQAFQETAVPDTGEQLLDLQMSLGGPMVAQSAERSTMRALVANLSPEERAEYDALPSESAKRDYVLAATDKELQEFKSARLADIKWQADSAAQELERLRATIDPDSLGRYAFDITTAAAQMTPSIAATFLTRRPDIGLAMMSSQVFGSRYYEARQNEFTPKQALAEATFFAMLEAATEKIPLGILTKDDGGVLRNILRSMGAEAVQEQIVELFDLAHERVLLGQEVTGAEALRRLLDAGIIGAGTGGLLSVGVAPATYQRSQVRQALDRLKQQGQLTQAQQQVQELQLNQRSPERMRQLLEGLQQDDSVLLSADAVADLVEKGVLTAQSITDLRIDSARLADELSRDGDVPVPLSSVLMLDEATFEQVSQHLRLAPGDPTSAEASALLKEREELVRARTEEAAAARAADPEARPIYDAVNAALLEQGLSASQADANAQLYEQHYSALAELYAEDVTAEQLFYEARLRIAGPTQRTDLGSRELTDFAEGLLRDTAGEAVRFIRDADDLLTPIEAGDLPEGAAPVLFNGQVIDLPDIEALTGPLETADIAAAMELPEVQELVQQAGAVGVRLPDGRIQALNVDAIVSPQDVRDAVDLVTQMLQDVDPDVAVQAAEEFSDELFQDIDNPDAIDDALEGLDLSGDSEQARADAEEILSAYPEEVRQLSALSILLEPEADVKRKTIEVAQLLQQRALQVLGEPRGEDTPENRERIAMLMAAEAEWMMRRPGSGADWYKEAIQRTHRVVAIKYPDILVDETKKAAFNYALAVTSNGQDVLVNVRDAMRVYEAYRGSNVGHMPDFGVGERDAQMRKAFADWNRYVDEFGLDWYLQFLNTEWTIKELGAMGFDVGGELADVRVPGSAILGPKIGGAFFANLQGNYNVVTMDLWWTRTWGRMTGTLLVTDQEKIDASERVLLDALRQEDLAIIEMTREEAEADPGRAAHLLHKWFSANIPVAWDAEGKVTQRKSYHDDRNNEATRAARQHDKLVNMPVQQPQNNSVRFQMRETAKQAVELLAQRGVSTDLADMQAVLWYGEKAVYSALGARATNREDFAGGAAKVLREENFSEDQIETALRAEGAAGGGARGPAGTVADAGAVGEGLAGGVFDRRQRRAHRNSHILRSILPGVPPPDVAGDAAQSGPFGRGPGRNHRFLVEGEAKPVKVASIAKYQVPGNKREGNLLKTAGSTPFPIFELESTPDAARAFRTALAASAASAQTGASVEIKEASSYEKMRLFLTNDGMTGFALNGDDIVSVFNNSASDRKGTALQTVMLGAQLGGRRLDAFDVGLPNLYSQVGFRAVSRVAWNDEFSPPGWDKEFVAQVAPHTGGEPDVVLMVYDPTAPRVYAFEDAQDQRFTDWDDAAVLQEQAKAEVAARSAVDVLEQSDALLDPTAGSPVERLRFHKWFGDSVISDPYGRPKVMYHGSTEQFSEFRSAAEHPLFFVAPDPDTAAFFADYQAGFLSGNGIDRVVLPFFVKSENPFDASNPAHVALVFDILMKQHPKSEPEDLLDDVVNGDNWRSIEDPAVLDRIKELGFDAIKVRENGVNNVAVFQSTQLKVADGSNRTFDPDDPNIYLQTNGGPRGGFRQERSTYGDIRNIITLTENRNLSTFLHESGHFWLFEMVQRLDDARLTDAGRAELERRILTVRNWFKGQSKDAFKQLKQMHRAALKAGQTNRAAALQEAIEHAEANGGAAYMEQVAEHFMDGTVDYGTRLETAFHELWARGFEQYLGEGVAPSSALRRAFQTFAGWMARIYDSLRSLNVSLTPEVRDVMDRLLAAEEAILEARAALEENIPEQLDPYLTPTQREALKQAAAEAERAAREQLIQVQAAAAKKRLTAEYKAAQARYTEEELEEVRKEPLYIARRLLVDGVLPNGEPVVQPIKLERDEVARLFGKKAAQSLPRAVLTKKGEAGIFSVSAIADMVGFEDGTALVTALLEKHPTEARLVKDRVAARLTAEFGDQLSPVALQEAAEAAIDNDQESELLALRLRILRSLTSQDLTAAAERRAEQEGVSTSPQQDAAARRASQAVTDTASAQADALAAEAVSVGNRPQRRAQAAAGQRFRQLVRELDLETAREAAEEQVEKMRVRDLTPQKYRAAAQRAARAAQKALASRDVAAAADAIQRQLINVELSRAVERAIDLVEKRVARYKRLQRSSDKRLAQRYDMDVFVAARELMNLLGVGAGRGAVPLETVRGVQGQLSPELQRRIDDAERLLLRAGPPSAESRSAYEQLPLLDFALIDESINETLAEARDSTALLLDGQRVHFDQVFDEMDVLNEPRRPEGPPPGQLASSDARRDAENKSAMQTFRMAMRRVENWAVRMDNGNPDGPYTKYIVRPIIQATTAYKKAQEDVLSRVVDVLTAHGEVLAAAQTIDAPEIGWRFKNKAELLHAVLHSGNESNLRKLLLGGQTPSDSDTPRPWGTRNADGSVNATQWFAFLDRAMQDGTLTKADMDLVQHFWDLAEQMKPAAQQAHRRAFGYYFPEVEARTLSTPWGDYRGGYVPAVTDPMMTADAQFNGKIDDVITPNSSRGLPGAEKGFTNARIESYAEPLLLDLTLLPVHFDTVLKFTHFMPVVRNVGRLIMHKRFKTMHMATAPQAGVNMLIPWLERVARQQTVRSSDGGKVWDRRLNNLNRAVGQHYMFGNIVNTAQQITGFISAALQVSPGLLMSGFMQKLMHPTRSREYIEQRSEFMRLRMSNSVNEAARTVRDFLLDPTPMERARAFADRHAYIFQQGMQNWMDPAVWIAAEKQFHKHGHWQSTYDGALAAGRSDADAAAQADRAAAEFADSTVRQTQAAMEAGDISSMEHGSPLWRITTKFMTYFNAMYNLNVTAFGIETEVHGFRRPHKLLYLYAVGIAMPAIIAEVITMLARGDLDDVDEDEPEELAAKVANLLVFSQAKLLAGAVPGGSATVGLLQGVFTSATYDDKLSLTPIVGPIEQMGSGARAAVVSAQEGELKGADRVTRGMLSAVAMLFGLPTNWLAKPVTYAIKVEEGKVDPETPLDILQGVLTGRDGTEK